MSSQTTGRGTGDGGDEEMGIPDEAGIKRESEVEDEGRTSARPRLQGLYAKCRLAEIRLGEAET